MRDPREQSFYIDYYSPDNFKKQNEIEVDYFAVSLLVPTDKLLKILEITDDISAIAKYFAVSESVVKAKICWLKSK